MTIAEQLTALFLQALPTAALVLLLYFFLRVHFFRPVMQVLDERAARIEGARQAAETAVAAAAEKQKAYAEALKRARGEIYAQQESARRAALAERAELIRQTRAQAMERIRDGKQRIAGELAAARQQLEADTPALAGEIVRAILERRPPARGGARPQ